MLQQTNLIEMDMKRFTVVLFFMLCLWGEVYSLNLSSTEEKATQVTLHGVTAKQPRNGFDITVVCYYCNGGLYIDFGEQVHDVSISITQIATGEEYSTDSVGCSQQFISLNMPSSPGLYYVIIEYDSSVLYGYFNL